MVIALYIGLGLLSVIAILLIVVFTGATILPYFANGQEDRNSFSIEKEKTEKENREKESSGETKVYIPNFHALLQNRGQLVSVTRKYAEMEVSFTQSCYLPVLTPPPDSI